MCSSRSRSNELYFSYIYILKAEQKKHAGRLGVECDEKLQSLESSNSVKSGVTTDKDQEHWRRIRFGPVKSTISF